MTEADPHPHLASRSFLKNAFESKTSALAFFSQRRTTFGSICALAPIGVKEVDAADPIIRTAFHLERASANLYPMDRLLIITIDARGRRQMNAQIAPSSAIVHRNLAAAGADEREATAADWIIAAPQLNRGQSHVRNVIGFDFYGEAAI